MNIFSRLSILYKVAYELGFRSVTLNGLYRFGLATGHYKRTLNAELKKMSREWSMENGRIHHIFPLPSAEEVVRIIGEEGKARVLAEADEIVRGKARLFGGEPVELKLSLDRTLPDWTAYETGKADLHHLTSDVKFLWEPARFGWAFTLGRAYVLTKDEKYPQAFWRYFEEFTQANPPYKGPNWMSGQEAALRLMAFAWAAQVFGNAKASTPERMNTLARSVAEHAARIPPTLVYARSQRNNHLLTEAAGLLTAGLALPNHPQAEKWRNLGWKWLSRGLPDQIDGYGEYAQHSTNYHRLMLEVVLWVRMMLRSNDLNQRYRFPRPAAEAVTRSVHWLLALLDLDSGQAPNLGANDGAYIFPLTVCPFQDYRPVLHTAAREFLDYDLPQGPWDELSLWFGVPLTDKRYVQLPRYLGDQLYGKDSWAALRMAQYTTRPSHADQLHLDLWWHGLNIARDAGTYLYNGEPPWENSLTTALVHNTVTVNGQDQMTRAGRFLYVDWLNAYRQDENVTDPEMLQRVRGRYRTFRLGYRHTRYVTALADGRWRVEDEILRLSWLPWGRRTMNSYRLHWLLPDWEWKVEYREAGFDVHIKSPHGQVILRVSGGTPLTSDALTIARAGEMVHGQGPAEPTRGWVSPTYGVKVPALSAAVEIHSADDVQFTSEFLFP